MPSIYIRRPGERVPQVGPRKLRVRAPRWVDPMPWIQGSEPEKMVMAALIERRIFFEHTPQMNSLGGGVDPTWEPDFLFPQFRIWLEVQGSYFHTLPGAIEADSFRFAVIEMAGWKPIWFWDYDIRSRLRELLDAIPEFYQFQPDTSVYSSEPWLESGDSVDHLKGLRQALANRARPPQNIVSKRRTKRRPK